MVKFFKKIYLSKFTLLYIKGEFITKIMCIEHKQNSKILVR